MGGYVQAYTLYSSVRPFGCSTIFAGADKSGPQLYLIEPSGVSYGYHGAAVGKGRQLAKTELEKLKLAEMSMREAVVEAARMYVFLIVFDCVCVCVVRRCGALMMVVACSIYLVHDDAKEKDFELEMTWVGEETNGVHLPVPQDLFDEASQKAKEALETFE